jgi:hypothetical protein
MVLDRRCYGDCGAAVGGVVGGIVGSSPPSDPFRKRANRGGRLRRARRFECFHETGRVSPGQMGGHKPKKISGAYRDLLAERCRDADFTLRGLGVELADRSLKIDYCSV